MNVRKRYLIIAIITGVLLLGFFSSELVFIFTNISSKYPVLSASFLVIVPLLAIAFVAFLFRYIYLVQADKLLIEENVYNLGEAIAFFDLHAFETRVTLLAKRRSNRSKKQYIIALTGANQMISINVNRDKSYASFNGNIAKLIDSMFVETKNKIKGDHASCFNHGIFYIYVSTDDDHFIRNLVSKISDGIFNINNENNYHISVSPFFGVSELDKDSSMIEVIENASIARNVSERNFEVLTFYHESFRRRSSQENIDEINNALRDKEFVVYYQPKFSLLGRRFVSSEALVRWNSKNHGLLSPAKFIPLAESAGLIHEIDTYVFKKVCEDLNDQKRRGKRIIPVSINFSIYEFYSESFLNSILDLLDQYKVSPSYIEIEITEATSQANTFISTSIIKKLRDHGIRVLMDDFGVGFSNIGNLKKIPFDAVKIDKSFIDDIATDAKARAIVKFLIDLCQANDLEVIAEGVDSKEQADILRKMKCNTIQGFYYSQALPLNEYEKFLLSNPFERKEGYGR